ncbi:hypothetical protein D9M69_410960 [compost metagenome]
MHRWEDGFAVLEVVQAGQLATGSDVAEICLGRVICRDAGRHDEAGTALLRRGLQEGLSKQCVGVHVAHSGERIAPAIVRKEASRFRTPTGGDEGVVKRHLSLVRWCQPLCSLQVGIQVVKQNTFAQPLDALTTLGLVPGRGH